MSECEFPIVQRSGSGNGQVQVFHSQHVAVKLEGRRSKGAVVGP